jgi:hypothetical protein
MTEAVTIMMKSLLALEGGCLRRTIVTFLVACFVFQMQCLAN